MIWGKGNTTVLITSKKKGTHPPKIFTCQPPLYMITVHTTDTIKKKTSLTFSPLEAVTGPGYKGVFTVSQTDRNSREVTLSKNS